MAAVRGSRVVTAGEACLFAFAILFPLGPRFETRLGNIYLATVAVLVWLAAWVVFVFAGPRGGLSVATPPQRALITYGGLLLLQILLHFGRLLERPAFLLRAVQLLAYMGLFATVSSLRIGTAVPGRLLRFSIAILAFECAVAYFSPARGPSGFLTGTFDGEHNSFGAYLLLMIPVVVAFLSHARSGWGRIAVVLLLAIGILSLAFTFSRTAYVAFPVAMIALIHRRWGGRAFFVSLLGVTGLVVAGAVMLPAGVRDRLVSIAEITTGESADISFMTRLALWRHAVEAFIETGFTGVGLYGFHYLDNYFVRALVETGVIGLALFLWLLVAIITWLAREYDKARDPDTRSLALGLYGATIGLMVVANAATDTFLVHRVMGLYWVLLGSLVAARRAIADPGRGGPLPTDSSQPRLA